MKRFIIGLAVVGLLYAVAAGINYGRHVLHDHKEEGASSISKEEKRKQKIKAHQEKFLYPLVYKATIKLEVDGEPITLSKNITCKSITTYKSQTSEYKRDVGRTFAMSHVLPTGEVVIASAPGACTRFKPGPENEDEKYDHYIKVKELPSNYLPYIAIADKQGLPDRVYVYASETAYMNPMARIKFKSVDVEWSGAGVEPDAYDPFHWFLAPDGVKGGKRVDYYGFGLRQAEQTDYIKRMIADHHEKSGGTKVLNFHTIEKHGWAWGEEHRKAFPHEQGASVRLQRHGGSIIHGGKAKGSVIENIVPLVFEDGADLINDDVYRMREAPEYKGMIVLQRMPLGMGPDPYFIKEEYRTPELIKKRFGDKPFYKEDHKPMHITLASGISYTKLAIRRDREQNYGFVYDPNRQEVFYNVRSRRILSYKDMSK